MWTTLAVVVDDGEDDRLIVLGRPPAPLPGFEFEIEDAQAPI